MPTTTAPRGATTRTRRTSIATKITAVVAGLVLVLLGTNAFLLLQLRSVSTTYDRLLAEEVQQAQLSRQMQVEFKKQVQEWKDVLLRGANPKDLDTYRSNFEREYTAVRTQSDALVRLVRDPQARATLEQFRTEHEKLQANYEAALSAFVASGGKGFRTADSYVRGQDRPPTNLLDAVVDRLQANVDARVAAQERDVAQRQRVLLVAGSAGVLALLVLLAVVVARIVRPVRRLTTAAHDAAAEQMPTAMARIAVLGATDEAPRLQPFEAGTNDELAALAGALSTMQDTVVDLAVEQRRRERETAEMLLNLGRRNQTLLARVLSQLTDLERVEQDPEVMAALFRIDHATTRVRRNAASMLVLAGAAPSPGRAQAVAVTEVVRAAMSEIEDYVRVDLYHVQDATVLGTAATDLTHLLAELLENATHFSPPSTRVTVVGQVVGDGYRIRVLDQGIGMTRDELEAANERIEASDAGPGDARLLGLHVVGRLAARNGFVVRLEPSADRGITATVTLPPDTVMTDAAPAAPAVPAQVSPAPVQRVVDVTPYDQAPTSRRPDAREADPWVAAVPPPAGPGYEPGNEPGNEPGYRPGHEPTYGTAYEPAAPQAAPPVRGYEPVAESPVLVAARQSRPAPADPSGRGADGQVPVRVRGAGLARLGLADETRAAAFAEAPADSSVRLRAFQMDVDAARRAIGDGPDIDAGR